MRHCVVEMRLRFKQKGSHVHCRLFTAPGKNLTFTNCGELVFSEAEWNDVKITFECGGAEVLEDGPPS